MKALTCDVLLKFDTAIDMFFKALEFEQAHATSKSAIVTSLIVSIGKSLDMVNASELAHQMADSMTFNSTCHYSIYNK